MQFSFNAVWDHTGSLLRTHFALAAAIAGVFMFLPNVLLGHALPPPEAGGVNAEADRDLMVAYLAATWHWQLLALAATMIGMLAILVLVLDRTRPTVGSAIGAAIKLLPFYLLGTLILGAGLLLAVFLCIMPFAVVSAATSPSIAYLGVFAALVLLAYSSGRFSMFAPVISVEHRTPLSAIRRSFEMTRGHGWAILAFLLLLLMAGGVASLAVSFVIGGLLRLLLPQELGDLMVLIVGSAFSTALTILIIVAIASIYRALSGGETTASLFE